MSILSVCEYESSKSSGNGMRVHSKGHSGTLSRHMARPLVLDPSYAPSQVLPELLLIKTCVQCHYVLVRCPHNQASYLPLTPSPNFILEQGLLGLPIFSLRISTNIKFIGKVFFWHYSIKKIGFVLILNSIANRFFSIRFYQIAS